MMGLFQSTAISVVRLCAAAQTGPLLRVPASGYPWLSNSMKQQQYDTLDPS